MRKRSRRAWVLVGLGVLVLATPRSALAADARISWSAPPECPSASSIEERVSALESVPGSIVASVKVEKEDGGYRAEIQSAAADGTPRERALVAETCEVLAEIVATVLATSHAAEKPPPPPLPPPAPTPPPPASSPSRRWSFGLGAQGVAEGGLLPDAALGAGVAGDVGTARVRLRVALSGLLPSEATSNLGSSASFHAFTARGMACTTGELGVRLGACAGWFAGLVRGQGGDVADARSEDRWVFGPELLVDGRFPARSRFALRAELGGRLSVVRPRFEVVNDSVIHRPSLFGLHVALGPEMIF